jgi:hypothetical protein
MHATTKERIFTFSFVYYLPYHDVGFLGGSASSQPEQLLFSSRHGTPKRKKLNTTLQKERKYN